jgi:hypothetical protein
MHNQASNFDAVVEEVEGQRVAVFEVIDTLNNPENNYSF